MKSFQNLPRASRGLLNACILGAALFAAGPASAQSLDIGLNFAEVDGWILSGDAAGTGGTLHLTGDFRTGAAHGIQLDLGGEVIDRRFLGQVDLHLYLAPREDRKYGFFASLADMDDQEFTSGSAGIEVMTEIAPGTVIEARAGAGLIRSGGAANVDFVAVSGAFSHALTQRTSVFAEATFADFDEAALSATSYDWMAGLRHGLGDGRIEVMAGFGAKGLWGRDSAPAEPVMVAGLTWRFSGVTGQKRGVAHRSFGTWQPARPPIALGRF